MGVLDALLLGLLQGLTEFLPVSSSGHLELGKFLLGVKSEDNLSFTIIVHGATVMSTIVVFRKDIWTLLVDLFKFEMNKSTLYIMKIALSMIPIAIVGLFFKDNVEQLFATEKILLLVGFMLLLTASLLAFTYYAKQKDKEISFTDAIIIGIAQTCAIVPGISRSGSTIAIGLLLGNKKAEVAKFSFLMVLVPILGENVLSLIKGDFSGGIGSDVDVLPLVVGACAAFASGLLACTWMINLVKKGKLIYFAIYCLIIGLIAIFVG